MFWGDGLCPALGTPSCPRAELHGVRDGEGEQGAAFMRGHEEEDGQSLITETG